MDLGIAGRTALVTGGSRGIGRAIAAALVAEGVRVAVSSRSLQRASETAREVGAEAGFAWDSRDPPGARHLLREVSEKMAPVDVLVCNTGGPPAGEDPLGFAPPLWEEAYRTLVLGPMALIENALPGMQNRGWGRILNVASTSVIEPIPSLMLSNAHRVSMVAAFKTLSQRFAADGVTLNTILPGRIATDRLFDVYGGHEAAATEAITSVPAARLGTPEEIAAASVFLCSAPAGYITGQSLAVDGGMLRST